VRDRELEGNFIKIRSEREKGGTIVTSGFHYLTSHLTTGALINRHVGYSVVNRIKQQEKVMDQLAR